MTQILHPYRSLEQRYNDFCNDLMEILETAGLSNPEDTPRIIGRSLLELCNTIASLHLPEDKEISGMGPRGMIWSMHSCVEEDRSSKTQKDPVMGARAIGITLRKILQYRPPIDEVEKPDYSERLYRNVNGNAVLESKKEITPDLCYIIHSAGPHTGITSSSLQSIQACLSSLGYSFEAPDQVDYDADDSEHISNLLKRADFVIADVSSERSICYYELGIAQVLKKNIIYLCENNSVSFYPGIPSKECISYSDNFELEKALKEKLTRTVAQARPLKKSNTRNRGL